MRDLLGASVKNNCIKSSLLISFLKKIDVLVSYYFGTKVRCDESAALADSIK